MLTIGLFDGVHRGHQALIAAAAAKAQVLGLPLVLMTFDPHPAEVLRPGSHPAELTALRRKAELVAQLGVDVFFVMPFTSAVAATEPEAFIHELIVDRLHSACVVVGDNFHFGHHGAGDVRLLGQVGQQCGFTAEGLGLVADGSLTVTSTLIRACVDAGDVRAAALALGRPHRLEGVVVRGEGRGGSELGYPTANLDMAAHAAIPADGVYAGWFILGKRRSPTAISIGTNPTFSGKVRTVEAFVLDEGGNFYGRRVALDFVERLRGIEKYSSVEALIEQIGADVAQTRTILRVPG